MRLIILPLDKPAESTQAKPRKIPGLVPANIGSGSFEDIMRLNEFQASDDDDEDDIMEPIAENRAMRRQIAKEQPLWENRS